MPDNISLVVVGSAVTYFAQIAVAYGLVRLLCLLIGARGRMWLWSGFLMAALLAWVGFLAVPLGLIAANHSRPVVHWPASAFEWSYGLESISALHSWGKWGLRFYLLFALGSLLGWVWGWFRLRVIVQLGCEPSSEVSLLFRRLARKMKVRSCQIVLVPQLRSPSMAGWLRPKVLLPSELLPQLKRSDLIDVLLHELIHVRRRDYLWDQLAALASRVVFFHSAVWLAYSHLRRERELACDQAMGGHLASRRLRYAECLMRIAKWWVLADGYSAQAIGVSSTASFLATRVRILLQEPSRRSQFQVLLRAGAVTAMALTGVYGVWSSRVTFYRVDGTQLAPPAQIEASLRGARRLHSAHALRSVHTPRSNQFEPTVSAHRQADSPPADSAQIEETLTYNGGPRRPVQSLTPPADLDRTEASWNSSAADPGVQTESKPVWHEGSIERSPLSRPGWAAAADAAMRVAIGVALASEKGEFSGNH